MQTPAEVAQVEDLTPKHLIIYQTDFNINFIKMKKSILILFCISTFSIAFTQGNNLQFNRVVNESSSSTTSSTDKFVSSGSINVPTNKVLKITSGSVYSLYNNTNNDYECGLRIDDHILIRRSTNNQGSDFIIMGLSYLVGF